MKDYDVIVVGLGAMGSAALATLAQRGHDVLGLEQFNAAHARGSSHGESRIIRQAYFEHPDYVPLLLRAYTLWDALQERVPLPLMERTGGLMLGTRDSETVRGSIASAEQWGLSHEVLDAGEIRRRFPQLRPQNDEVGVYEAEAGYVRPEAGILAHLLLALTAGAEAHFGDTVTGVRASAGRVLVETKAGGRYRARRAILSLGAWTADLVDDLPLPLSVERQVLTWLRPPRIEPFLLSRFPVYVWEVSGGLHIYGIPTLDQRTVKGSIHHHGQLTTAEALDRIVQPEEVDRYLDLVMPRIPDLGRRVERSSVCMYTNTPDGHFAVGLHPGHPELVVAAGFSGHGYKFSPVMGEILADLATEGGTDHPIGFLNPGRFAIDDGPPC